MVLQCLILMGTNSAQRSIVFVTETSMGKLLVLDEL
jgi:hypothetical protein